MIEVADPNLSYKEFPGPLLLLAGPGTGKTWQLAMRVKYLVEERHVDSGEIAVVTFTNEAARNMRERLASGDIGIRDDRVPGLISTMHSLGNQILGSAPEIFGLPSDYDLIDDDEARQVLLEDAATIAGYDRTLWAVADECRRKGNCVPAEATPTCRICREYKTILRKCGRVDYDDQILLACEMLKSSCTIRAQWQSRTHYLLVDEYQDINQAQCELIELLSAGQTEGLFAAGDDDQSIYSFRGGSPEYIKKFHQQYGAATKLARLSQSRRCPEHILRGASAVLAKYYQDSIPKPEPVFGDTLVENSKIRFFEMPSHEWEAQKVAGLAQTYLKGASVIVIIPNSKYFSPIGKALARRRIPFTYKRGLDPKGIVRVAVLADWAEKPHDNVASRHLLDLVISNHDELMTGFPEGANLTGKREAASELLAHLWPEVNENASLYEVLCRRAEHGDHAHFLGDLRACLEEVRVLLSENGKSRKHLPPFLLLCGFLVSPGRNPAGLADEVCDLRSGTKGVGVGSSYGPVRIYNLRSAKGLEGDVVMVVGLSAGLFPNPKDDVAESARLMYVAMTRARKLLCLFSSRTRPASITFQPHSFQLQRSPFVSAIPTDHLEEHVTYATTASRM